MPRRKTIPPPAENLTELEAHLAVTLKPVAPPRGFPQRLRERVRIPEPRIIAERIASWRFFFVAIGGTMSAMILVITVARALFHLVGRRS